MNPGEVIMSLAPLIKQWMFPSAGLLLGGQEGRSKAPVRQRSRVSVRRWESVCAELRWERDAVAGPSLLGAGSSSAGPGALVPSGDWKGSPRKESY